MLFWNNPLCFSPNASFTDFFVHTYNLPIMFCLLSESEGKIILSFVVWNIFLFFLNVCVLEVRERLHLLRPVQDLRLEVVLHLSVALVASVVLVATRNLDRVWWRYPVTCTKRDTNISSRRNIFCTVTGCGMKRTVWQITFNVRRVFGTLKCIRI